MPKVFRPSTRESNILSKIESSKEHEKKSTLNSIKERIEEVCNSIAMKLVENRLIETTNKSAIEEQIKICIEKLIKSDDFEIDYQISPFRFVVPTPNVVSLYITAFVVEQLINHKDVVDIFGSDEEIYHCINRQVTKFIHN
ncbi:MAG: hypothetical protein HQK79_20895 [Desulfobacterales bacterium]|nr:hypothetical protein [Desulfobacterales bacterium]MBF0397298.1 hypothetical protein [Desulfobacterales bacterium]